MHTNTAQVLGAITAAHLNPLCRFVHLAYINACAPVKLRKSFAKHLPVPANHGAILVALRAVNRGLIETQRVWSEYPPLIWYRNALQSAMLRSARTINDVVAQLDYLAEAETGMEWVWLEPSDRRELSKQIAKDARRLAA